MRSCGVKREAETVKRFHVLCAYDLHAHLHKIYTFPYLRSHGNMRSMCTRDDRTRTATAVASYLPCFESIRLSIRRQAHGLLCQILSICVRAELEGTCVRQLVIICIKELKI